MRQRKAEGKSVNPDGSRRGIEFAWKTHAAVTDWTAKVDTKSAIVLSLGGALLGFFVTLSTNGRILTNLQGWHLIVERIGLASAALGVLFAALVVLPRLNRRKTKRHWKDNFVYFGHLRHWDPVKLKARLQQLTEDDELQVLSNQLIATSRIAWYKHGLLQAAMVLLVAGVGVVALAVI